MSVLDLKFDYYRNLNVSGNTMYKANFVGVNPDLLADDGQAIVPHYELPDFTIGTQDTTNFIFTSFTTAATFYYTTYAALALAFINENMKGPGYASSRLVNTKDDDDVLTTAKGMTSATVALTSGATNTMTATITALDDKGVAIAAVQDIEVFIGNSAAATGGLTTTAASGALTATTGSILTALTAKKHVRATTDANGVLVLSLVDTAKTQGEYVNVVIPRTGRIVTSAASVTASYGA